MAASNSSGNVKEAEVVDEYIPEKSSINDDLAIVPDSKSLDQLHSQAKRLVETGKIKSVFGEVQDDFKRLLAAKFMIMQSARRKICALQEILNVPSTQISESDDMCEMYLIKSCTNVSSSKFLDALYETKDYKSLEIIVDFFKTGKCPRRTKSLAVEPSYDANQTRRLQLQDRSFSTPTNTLAGQDLHEDMSQLHMQPTDDGPESVFARSSASSAYFSDSSLTTDNMDKIDREEFYCEESATFWYFTPPQGMLLKKTWKEFRKNLKSSFPNDGIATESRSNNVLSLLAKFLKITGKKEDKVNVYDFVRILGWFGPLKANTEGLCINLQQIGRLIKESTTKNRSQTTRLSWFAGYMTTDQANILLKDQNEKTFLVRFSESDADGGTFSIAIVVEKGIAPVHYQIRGNPKEAVSTNPFHAKLDFDDHDEKFAHIVEVVNHLRTHSLERYPDIYCTQTCPDLPLNTTFTGYKQPRTQTSSTRDDVTDDPNSQARVKESIRVSQASSVHRPIEHEDL